MVLVHLYTFSGLSNDVRNYRNVDTVSGMMMMMMMVVRNIKAGKLASQKQETKRERI